jgi:hypothetical protein
MYAGYDAPHTLFRVGRGFPCQRFSVSGRIRDTARIEKIPHNDVGVSVISITAAMPSHWHHFYHFRSLIE